MRFGSREICDVTFKTTRADQKVGKTTYAHKYQPVFVIDTATASTLSQETSVVYAKGGKGYTNLISWEGEKNMSFSVTDALLSTQSLAVLTDAGEIEEGGEHFHVALDFQVNTDGIVAIDWESIKNELGLKIGDTESIKVCADVPIFANVLDDFGAISAPVVVPGKFMTKSGNTYTAMADTDIKSASYLVSIGKSTPAYVKFDKDDTAGNNIYKGKTVKVDFYVIVESGVTTIRIKPESFGGNFYVEADTLYRNQAGEDMAAALTFPQVKVQSAFELSMSPTGDPSTFEFKMDAMPGYTMFDKTHKTCVDIQIIGSADNAKATVHNDVDATVDHEKKTQ